MSEFKIDKNVAISPDRFRGRTLKYPFPYMEVGDSFFVPQDPGITRTALTNKVSGSATLFKQRHQPDWVFTIRSRHQHRDGEEGVRIWRTQ